MKKLGAIIVIALCLSPNASQGAEIGDENNNPNFEAERAKKYKGATKAIAIMSMLGVSGKNISETAYFVDERLEGKEFRFHESSYNGFNMKLQFNTEKIKAEGFEVKFTNDSLPNWQLKGNSESALINYHVEW